MDSAIAGVIVSAVSAGTTIALVWLTARYVKLTNALVEEARASKFPTVYLDLELDPGMSKFIIGNAGNSPAINIRLDVAKDAMWSPLGKGGGAGIAGLAPAIQGISYLAPGRVLKFTPGTIDDTEKFFAVGSTIQIALSYQTESGHLIKREVLFNLSSYSGVLLESFRRSGREIADAIERVAQDRKIDEFTRRNSDQISKKSCPSCGEKIAITAKKCRFCHESIPTEKA